MTQNIIKYFDDYPESNECFTSSDGYIFHERDKAESYALTLKDKTVTPYKRESLESEKKAKNTKPSK